MAASPAPDTLTGEPAVAHVDEIRLLTILDLQEQVRRRRQHIQALLPAITVDERALAAKRTALSELQAKLDLALLKRRHLVDSLARELAPSRAATTATDSGGSLCDTSLDPTLSQQSSPLHTPLDQVLSRNPASAPEDAQGSVPAAGFTPRKPSVGLHDPARLRALVKDRTAQLEVRLEWLRSACDRLAVRVGVTHAEIRSSAGSSPRSYGSLSASLKRRHDRQEESHARQLIREVRRDIEQLSQQIDIIEKEREEGEWEAQDEAEEEERRTGCAPSSRATANAPAASLRRSAVGVGAAQRRHVVQLGKELSESTRELRAAENRLRSQSQECEEWAKTVASLEGRLRALRQHAAMSPEALSGHQKLTATQ